MGMSTVPDVHTVHIDSTDDEFLYVRVKLYEVKLSTILAGTDQDI